MERIFMLNIVQNEVEKRRIRARIRSRAIYLLRISLYIRGTRSRMIIHEIYNSWKKKKKKFRAKSRSELFRVGAKSFWGLWIGAKFSDCEMWGWEVGLGFRTRDSFRLSYLYLPIEITSDLFPVGRRENIPFWTLLHFFYFSQFLYVCIVLSRFTSFSSVVIEVK